MLEKLSEEEVEAIGRAQKDQTIKEFLFFKSGLTLESFIEWIAIRCEMLGFELEQRDEGGSMLVIIYHGMGYKWSCYYKGLFLAVLEDLVPEQDWREMSPTASDSLFSVGIQYEKE